MPLINLLTTKTQYSRALHCLYAQWPFYQIAGTKLPPKHGHLRDFDSAKQKQCPKRHHALIWILIHFVPHSLQAYLSVRHNCLFCFVHFVALYGARDVRKSRLKKKKSRRVHLKRWKITEKNHGQSSNLVLQKIALCWMTYHVTIQSVLFKISRKNYPHSNGILVQCSVLKQTCLKRQTLYGRWLCDSLDGHSLRSTGNLCIFVRAQARPIPRRRGTSTPPIMGLPYLSFHPLRTTRIRHGNIYGDWRIVSKFVDSFLSYRTDRQRFKGEKWRPSRS